MSKRKGDPGYKSGWCIHYRAPSESNNGTCAAGISYNSFSKEDRIMTRCPCFIKPGQKLTDRAYCQKVRPPTEEEIRLHNELVTQRTGRLVRVLEHIADLRAKHQKQNFADRVQCPICKGRLHLSITRNGHVHGRCETPDCVAWLE